MRHYHILWSNSKTKFDHEAHPSEEAANKRAMELVQPNERWEVVEIEGECGPTCLAMLTLPSLIRRPSQGA